MRLRYAAADDAFHCRMSSQSFQSLSNFIWSVADLLRGPYRPPQYERVMLPMTVLRRFDCVLAPTKAKVLAEYRSRPQGRQARTDDALDKHAEQGGRASASTTTRRSISRS